jgi:hypothetical protein
MNNLIQFILSYRNQQSSEVYIHFHRWARYDHKKLQIFMFIGIPNLQPRETCCKHQHANKFHVAQRKLNIISISRDDFLTVNVLINNSIATIIFTWCGSFTGTVNVLFWEKGISRGVPGYGSDVDPSKSVPLPLRTTKTSSHECLWTGVLWPALTVSSHTST